MQRMAVFSRSLQNLLRRALFSGLIKYHRIEPKVGIFPSLRFLTSSFPQSLPLSCRRPIRSRPHATVPLDLPSRALSHRASLSCRRPTRSPPVCRPIWSPSLRCPRWQSPCATAFSHSLSVGLLAAVQAAIRFSNKALPPTPLQ